MAIQTIYFVSDSTRAEKVEAVYVTSDAVGRGVVHAYKVKTAQGADIVAYRVYTPEQATMIVYLVPHPV